MSKNIALCLIVISISSVYYWYIEGTVYPEGVLNHEDGFSLGFMLKIFFVTFIYGGVGFFLGRWLSGVLDSSSGYVYVLFSSALILLVALGSREAGYWFHAPVLDNFALYFSDFYPAVSLALFFAIGGVVFGGKISGKYFQFITETVYYFGVFILVVFSFGLIVSV